MVPRDCLIHMLKNLSEYERAEILDYDMVYYLNPKDEKHRNVSNMRPPTTTDGPENNGFDNDRSEYICEAKDQVAYRYEV